MPVRVKICGITNAEDALAAVDAGADALGFIFFAGSPRFVEPAVAQRIIARLPPFVSTVGVFVDETFENVERISGLTELTAIQLHGNEPPAFCAALTLPVIKAFRIRDKSSLDQLKNYDPSAFLLDSYVPGQLGGTGAKFNWEFALEAKPLGKPIILAGGLTPDNVADAVVKTLAYAVDVSSGVEFAPGRKDAVKMRDFIAAAKTSVAV